MFCRLLFNLYTESTGYCRENSFTYINLNLMLNHKIKSALLLMLLVLILVNCSQTASEPEVITSQQDIDAARAMLKQQLSGNTTRLGKEKLSEYGFFTGDLRDLTAAEGVIPYDLNTPLFSDYAHKLRFFKLPEGKTITYKEKEVLDFPVGTYIIKNFYYDLDETDDASDRRIMETRLLHHAADGWQTLPSYVWNDEQTEAYLTVEGAAKDVSWVNEDGEETSLVYSVPSLALCKSCHVNNGILTPIGPKARQLNRDFDFVSGTRNQLEHYSRLGLLTQLPKISKVYKSPVWNDPSTGSLRGRALAYLDMNCAHCHSQGGPGNTSALHLTEFETDEFHLGIDKHPIAAGKGSGGRPYDIVKGDPDNSIMVYRMESTDPGEMMPEVGRKMAHHEGVSLIKDWISSMK